MKIEGVYSTVEEAERAVHRLRDQGYSHDDITIAVNQEVRNQLDANVDAEVATNEETKSRSMWDSIKNFFTMDDSENMDYQADINVPAEYATQVKEGQIAVFVAEDAQRTDEPETTTPDAHEGAQTNKMQKPDETQTPEKGSPEVETDEEMIDDIEKHRAEKVPEDELLDREISTNHFDEEFEFNKDEDQKRKSGNSEDSSPSERKTTSAHGNDEDDDEDEKIVLREERLDADVEKEKTGEVHVRKKVVEDEESVDVPVTKEEVTIEKKPVSDRETTGEEIELEDDEEIVIPVEEEKAKAKKDTDIVEEVEIKKEKKKDVETVEGTVRREELEVEEDGDVLDSVDEDVEQPDDDDTLDRDISTNHFDEEFEFNQDEDQEDNE